MNVGELIEELKKHDPKMEILITTASEVATYQYYHFEPYHIDVRFLGPEDNLSDRTKIHRNYLVIE